MRSCSDFGLQFTREFKYETVKLIRERGVTVAQAARDFGLHGTVLRRWVREGTADQQQAFPGQGQMKPDQLEIERLRREATKLKAERDILKKAAVGSTDERNTWREYSRWRLKPQRLPRALIHDDVERVLSHGIPEKIYRTLGEL